MGLMLGPVLFLNTHLSMALVKIKSFLSKLAWGNTSFFNYRQCLGHIRYSEWYMVDSEPKWVNLVLKTIGVNSLRLGGLHIIQNQFM